MALRPEWLCMSRGTLIASSLLAAIQKAEDMLHVELHELLSIYLVSELFESWLESRGPNPNGTVALS